MNAVTVVLVARLVPPKTRWSMRDQIDWNTRLDAPDKKKAAKARARPVRRGPFDDAAAVFSVVRGDSAESLGESLRSFFVTAISSSALGTLGARA